MSRMLKPTTLAATAVTLLAAPSLAHDGHGAAAGHVHLLPAAVETAIVLALLGAAVGLGLYALSRMSDAPRRNG